MYPTCATYVKEAFNELAQAAYAFSWGEHSQAEGFDLVTLQAKKFLHSHPHVLAPTSTTLIQQPYTGIAFAWCDSYGVDRAEVRICHDSEYSFYYWDYDNQCFVHSEQLKLQTSANVCSALPKGLYRVLFRLALMHSK